MWLSRRRHRGRGRGRGRGCGRRRRCSALSWRTAELGPAADDDRTVRRGQGYTLRVSVVPSVHRQLLTHCQPFADIGDPGTAQDSPRVRADGSTALMWRVLTTAKSIRQ
ncbi:hypothetical protein GCM10010260_70310 [Streptomyces filipinensis]|uniref:Uncharacterized protein n=1 Tax=Streptomyces filipinensis TaxID=66887 RepID=A0A918MF44_9ACTN|nr:hypothetical protein GCM10010260_70310 [Streptomyces filipinensis]